MYEEADLLPLSGLQHLVYCARQWGLIHLEQQWGENRLTAEGRVLHERADTDEVEVRGDIRIYRGLMIQSRRLGLAGRADVVEFHRETGVWSPESGVGESSGLGPRPPDSRLQTPACPTPLPPDSGLQTPDSTRLPAVAGLWRPFPVEYKRGRPKKDISDKAQLCAQALCLEEMLGVHIPAGALFYGQQRRRLDVPFDAELRGAVVGLALRMHALFDARETPPPEFGKKCEQCSLLALCAPRALQRPHAYMARALSTRDEG